MLTPSLEDYLEAIYIISREKKVARVKEVAEFLDVKTSSVVGALKILKNKGFVEQERYGYIYLTAKGIKKAEEIYRKHNLLVEFLIDVLDLPKHIAEADACKMEHVLSKETFEKLAEFIEHFKKCPYKKEICME